MAHLAQTWAAVFLRWCTSSAVASAKRVYLGSIGLVVCQWLVLQQVGSSDCSHMHVLDVGVSCPIEISAQGALKDVHNSGFGQTASQRPRELGYIVYVFHLNRWPAGGWPKRGMSVVVLWAH